MVSAPGWMQQLGKALGDAASHALTVAKDVGEDAAKIGIAGLQQVNKSGVPESAGVVTGQRLGDLATDLAGRLTDKLPEGVASPAKQALTSLAALVTSGAGAVVERAGTKVDNTVLREAIDLLGSGIKGTGAGVVANQVMHGADEAARAVIK